jgi:hypothetical protein
MRLLPAAATGPREAPHSVYQSTPKTQPQQTHPSTREPGAHPERSRTQHGTAVLSCQSAPILLAITAHNAVGQSVLAASADQNITNCASQDGACAHSISRQLLLDAADCRHEAPRRTVMVSFSAGGPAAVACRRFSLSDASRSCSPALSCTMPYGLMPRLPAGIMRRPPGGNGGRSPLSCAFPKTGAGRQSATG